MKTLRWGFIIIALTTLLGCTATGPLFSTVSSTIPAVPTDKGRIYFYRPDTMLGAAVTSDINLNGRIVGVSVRGSIFYADEAPGKCVVRTSTEVEKELSFILEAGETKYVKTSVSLGFMVGRIQPELVNPEQGANEISELHYTGGPKQ